MNQQERAERVKSRLDQIYPDPAIPLLHNNPFTLLIAVVLSAQATDRKVNEITPKLFKKAPDPERMYKLGEESIREHIKQIGLYKTKAKNIHKLSMILLNDFEGNVPGNFEDLESLPGVGHKTASVVMSQAFNEQTFPIDTHIHRLAQRWGLSKGINVSMTEKDLKRLFPKESWNKLHLQIIYYGREFCTAKKCDGTKCSLCRELYPKRTKPVIINHA